MTFRDFSKNLTQELEKVLANLGDSTLPEKAHRLDHQQSGNETSENVDISAILERMKNLDSQDSK